VIEGVGGIVREITGTVIFGVCKVKGKNVERWPTYVLDYIKETKEEDMYKLLPEFWGNQLPSIMQGRTDYENMLPMTIGIKK
jgi:hypothetical protein